MRFFVNAVPHEDKDLQLATQRKQRGQPSGKYTNPIGDELTWEQILSRFAGRKKLWIITRDSDYGTIYEGRGFLNQVLYEELRKVSPDAEAFLFGDVASGLKHFADITGVKADNLPSPEQIEEIKKETEALPPLGWMPPAGWADDAIRATILTRNRQIAAVSTTWTPLPLIAAASADGVGSTLPAGDTTETPK